MGQFSGVSTSLSRSFRSTRSASNSVISVRTSDQSYQSFGGGSQSSYLTPTGTGSFVSMHGDIVEKLDFKPVSFSIDFPSDEGEDYVPPTGELDPEFASPVGDVLLPLLLMAFVYTVVRFWRNRKLLLRSK